MVFQPNASPKQRSEASPLILVVDDEPAVRRVLELHIERFGYRVVLAAGGAEGLEVYRARSNEIALVLLDVQMPWMSGPATLAELRQIDPSVRCWFMSGFPAGLLLPPSDNAVPVPEVLEKPFRMDRLEALLRSALGPPPGRA